MFLRRLCSVFVLTSFLFNCLGPIPHAQADMLGLPQPGTMVNLSPAYQPTLIKGLTVHKDNPFLFDFIVDTGDTKATTQSLKVEADRMIKYFFACLTIPEKDLWVNLSPYEKDRMVPQALGQTALGRDLLAEDYILKQLTASLIYPEKNLGKEFWNRVYAKAQEMYGTTQIPVNTFNKVWILADKATVYEHNQTAFVVSGHLKVMLDEDYLALQKHSAALPLASRNDSHSIGANIIRTIVLPEIEKEVNTGKNFATLRQIFYAQILATWYKKNLKEALLNQVYADKSTVKGVNLNDPSVKEQIYQQYLKAYKKGVFNYIKEEADPSTQQTIPRKYFSGGYKSILSADGAMTVNTDPAMGSEVEADFRPGAFKITVMANAAMKNEPADSSPKFGEVWKAIPSPVQKKIKLVNKLPSGVKQSDHALFLKIGSGSSFREVYLGVTDVDKEGAVYIGLTAENAGVQQRFGYLKITDPKLAYRIFSYLGNIPNNLNSSFVSFVKGMNPKGTLNWKDLSKPIQHWLLATVQQAIDRKEIIDAAMGVDLTKTQLSAATLGEEMLAEVTENGHISDQSKARFTQLMSEAPEGSEITDVWQPLFNRIQELLEVNLIASIDPNYSKLIEILKGLPVQAGPYMADLLESIKNQLPQKKILIRVLFNVEPSDVLKMIKIIDSGYQVQYELTDKMAGMNANVYWPKFRSGKMWPESYAFLTGKELTGSHNSTTASHAQSNAPNAAMRAKRMRKGGGETGIIIGTAALLLVGAALFNARNEADAIQSANNLIKQAIADGKMGKDEPYREIMVNDGDTAKSIVADTGVSVTRFYDINHINKKTDSIKVGQWLVLPDRVNVLFPMAAGKSLREIKQWILGDTNDPRQIAFQAADGFGAWDPYGGEVKPDNASFLLVNLSLKEYKQWYIKSKKEGWSIGLAGGMDKVPDLQSVSPSQNPAPTSQLISQNILKIPGGIDLNSGNMAMTVTKDANGGVVVNFDPAMIARIRRRGVQSVVPVIINVQSMTPADLQPLLGLAPVQGKLAKA